MIHRYAKWQHSLVSQISSAHGQCVRGELIKHAVAEQIGSANVATGYTFTTSHGEVVPATGPKVLDIGEGGRSLLRFFDIVLFRTCGRKGAEQHFDRLCTGGLVRFQGAPKAATGGDDLILVVGIVCPDKPKEQVAGLRLLLAKFEPGDGPREVTKRQLQSASLSRVIPVVNKLDDVDAATANIRSAVDRCVVDVSLYFSL
jgi:hypothetical protein